MKRRICTGLLACLAWAGVPNAHALLHEPIFGSGFEIPTDLPQSDAEAARFLTQATFGPTLAEVARLRAIGYSEAEYGRAAFHGNRG